MKKSILALIVALISVNGCANKTKHAKSKFVKDYISRYKVDKTIDIIKTNMAKKNYTFVGNFDHVKDATKLKEMLYPNYTLSFNNPKITTKLLQCSPTLSMDLPIRVGVYNEINGSTHVSFTDSEYWSLKHNVTDSKCLQLLILIKQDMQDMADAIKKESSK